LQDAQALLSNIQWFLELSVADFSPNPLPGWQSPEDTPFHNASLYEALKDFNSYFNSRQLTKDWNADAASRRRYFWIFACLLHQLVALFDRWRKQDSVVHAIIPSSSPGQRLAGLATDMYDRHSRSSTSILHAVQRWRQETSEIFSGRQFTTHHRLQVEPPPAFFDGPTPAAYPVFHPAPHNYPPPPPPTHQHHQQPPARYQQPPPPPPPHHQQAPPPRHANTPTPPPAIPPLTASKFLLTYAPSATPEHRNTRAAVDFMRQVIPSGKAPVLLTKNIGSHKSDRQLCLAFCFQGAPFTGCRGNRGRACHRVHLDCNKPDALPSSALGPLVAWLRTEPIRSIIAPTNDFSESSWWTQNP
jgi:hypothetical protein